MQPTRRGWVATTQFAVAGEQRVTVEATLTDGRTYLKPLAVTTALDGTPKPAWEAKIGSAVMSRLVRDGAGDTLYIPSMGGDWTRWSYRLEPGETPGTTVLTQAFQLLVKFPVGAYLFELLALHVTDRRADLQANLQVGVDRIKAIVERAPRP